MLTRALLVLLVVLNAGVGMWWLLRPVVVDPLPPAQVAIPRLVLVREQSRVAARLPGAAGARPAAPPGTAPPAAATTAVAAIAAMVPEAVLPAAASTSPGAARCFRVGPFNDATLLAQAGTRLRSGGSSVQARSDAAAPSRGWQVVIAPAADREAAQQVAAAIGAAGFDDYFVVPTSNAIALGRYGSEASARGRESALRAKGFAAIAEPLAAATARSWLDVTVSNPQVDAARLRVAAGEAAVEARPCSREPSNLAQRLAPQAAAPAR